MFLLKVIDLLGVVIGWLMAFKTSSLFYEDFLLLYYPAMCITQVAVPISLCKIHAFDTNTTRNCGEIIENWYKY